jgi:hypothetical protein
MCFHCRCLRKSTFKREKYWALTSMETFYILCDELIPTYRCSRESYICRLPHYYSADHLYAQNRRRSLVPRQEKAPSKLKPFLVITNPFINGHEHFIILWHTLAIVSLSFCNVPVICILPPHTITFDFLNEVMRVVEAFIRFIRSNGSVKIPSNEWSLYQE